MQKTIKIKSDLFEGGFLIIGESDFDPEKHELFKEEVALISLAEAEAMNRDQLRDYAKNFDITGRTKEDIFEALKESGKVLEEDEEEAE